MGGHEEIMLILLNHGAEVDRSDREGRTPLIACSLHGSQRGSGDPFECWG